MMKKFKISQLAAKPIDVNLVHPKHGETGIVIKMVGPHSKAWRDALDEYQKDPEAKDANLKLMSSTLVGWDKDDFEVDFSPEAVQALLADPANEWITTQLVERVGQTALFFL